VAWVARDARDGFLDGRCGSRSLEVTLGTYHRHPPALRRTLGLSKPSARGGVTRPSPPARGQYWAAAGG
jgi:hypothetical protein